MSIEVKNLLKSYGEQKAVDHISFSINKGEIVGFLGPNGAGKSTTMKMITGYLEPDEGEIKVCGIDVNEKPLETKKSTGYLPEANPLYHEMYVKEYLEFVAGVHEIGAKTEAISKSIDITGLRSESKKKIGQLSKGFKQRVGLAAALIHNPEVLILDEPTSGLDPNQIIEIREVIRELGEEKTVLFSSHILQEVEALCDRVIIINKGQLVADDTVVNLQKKKTGDYINVRFREPLEAEWLQRLPPVRNLQKIDSFNWSLETNDPDSLRKQLLELALQHNLNIVSLQTESQNLEEIFRSLTNK
jgi:ABC-2 type transport system ATP-binding protein